MGVTFYFLLKDNPIPQLVRTIRSVNPFFLILGVLAMFGFICCEAGNTKIIMESLRYKISFLRHLKYSFVGFTSVPSPLPLQAGSRCRCTI